MFDLLSKLGYQPNNDKAICIVHEDTNPSLSFNNEVWYCHGCGIGGDKIKLIEHTRNCSFIEAIAYLSDLTNYQLHNINPNKTEQKNIHIRNISSLINLQNNPYHWKLLYVKSQIDFFHNLYDAWCRVLLNNKSSWLYDFFEYICDIIYHQFTDSIAEKKHLLYLYNDILNNKYEEIQKRGKIKIKDTFSFKSDLSIVKEKILVENKLTFKKALHEFTRSGNQTS